ADRGRGARVAVSRRAHRHGGVAPLRRTRDPRDQDLRPAVGLAELDLHPRQLDGRAWRAHALRSARAAAIPMEEDLMTTPPKTSPHRVRRWSDLLVPAIRRRKADTAPPVLLAASKKPRSLHSSRKLIA